MNLADRTSKWKVPIGYFSGSTNKNVMNNNRLYVWAGTSGLISFDKTTGVKIWSNANHSYHQHMFDNNMIFANSSDGVVGLNASDGSEVWRGTTITIVDHPFAVAGDLYSGGGDLGNFFIKSNNGLSGAEKWRTKTDFRCLHPLVVGNEIFTYRRYNYNGSTTEPYLMIFDRLSGAIKDSIRATPNLDYENVTIVKSNGEFLRAN